jgi:DNA-binding CsgD family transcriptional regulator
VPTVYASCTTQSDAAVARGGAARLFGREPELGRLEALIEDIDEHGKALVVRGEAGIGKSAVLAELARRSRARGACVVTAAGVESEAELSFSGLHSLLMPALGGLDRLPEPRRQAISAAFGMVSGPAPDRFLIALAALELLTDLAAESPVVAIVEDAQWLDPASADSFAFLARRVDLDPVVLLFAIRDGKESRFDQLGLEEIRVGPLPQESATALLDALAPELPPSVRTRVLEEAAGNPLALLELPKGISEDRADGGLAPGLVPMTDRLQRTFSARARDLPRETQTLLLLAALDDRNDVGEIVAAARLISAHIGEEHLAPAASAGLLRLRGNAFEFRHPLVRSAIYETATIEERREANAALAEVLASDSGRSVWHRAAAAEGPDADVVEMLETAAVQAGQRGDAATAMAAFERAARLTASEAAQGAYLIRAAEMAFSVSAHDGALRLLRQAEPLNLDATDRTVLLWSLERFEPRWTGVTRIPALVEMAKNLAAGGDELRALQVLEDIALRCWWGNPPLGTRTLVVEATESLELPASRPELLSVLAQADPVGQGERVIEQLSRLLSGPDHESLDAQRLGLACTAVWADDMAAEFLAAAASGARAQGKLSLLTEALVAQAWASFHLGRWDTASTSAAEAAALAGDTSLPRWVLVARLAKAAVSASRGDAHGAEQIVDECEQALLAHGATPLLALVQFVRGRCLLAAGRNNEAYDELRRILDPTEPPYQPFASVWTVVDLAEAAAHAGLKAEARHLLEPLESISAHSGGELLHSSLRFARAILADDEEIESELEQALSTDLNAWPFTRARLLLAQGAWLRRQRQVAAARTPLRAARATFDALGARPWAERAAQELRAAGEAPRPRSFDLRLELTAQELQIAWMAADGLTNREIGEKLFLSHRTIGTHLHRVFPKLGVTSRGQLRRALQAAEAS